MEDMSKCKINKNFTKLPLQVITLSGDLELRWEKEVVYAEVIALQQKLFTK